MSMAAINPQPYLLCYTLPQPIAETTNIFQQIFQVQGNATAFYPQFHLQIHIKDDFLGV